MISLISLQPIIKNDIRMTVTKMELIIVKDVRLTFRIGSRFLFGGVRGARGATWEIG